MDKRPVESTSSENKAKKSREEPPDKTDVEKENIFIPELPVEVIDQIFRPLSVRDRRNASLVCRNWCEAGSFKMYSEMEKFVFRGYENYETLLSFLSETNREFLNLEFHHCTFQNSSNLLSMGEKIHSLCFIDCTLSEQFKIELFIKCTNLKEFCYRNEEEVSIRDTEPCFNHQIINSLTEKGFVNKNLQKLWLSVIAESELLTDYVSISMYLLFPKIKHLKFLETPRKDSYGGNEDFTDSFSNYEDSFSNYLIAFVNMQSNELETLKIAVQQPAHRLRSHGFDRLKRISVSVEWRYIRYTKIIDFISGLVNLEKVSMKINCKGCETQKSINPFILKFIQRCLHLKSVTIIDTTSVGLYLSCNRELFQALVSSNLIKFKTNAIFSDDDDNEPFSASNFSMENKTLQILSITKCSDDQLLTLFIQCFKNLKSMDIGSPEVVKSISDCQKNLKSLKIHYGSEYLRSLTSLESLNLSLADDDDDDDIPFDCANIPLSVKYLRLSGSKCSESVNEVLSQSLVALKNVKGLEAVSLETNDKRLTDLNLWIDVCSSLKKLRLLCLHGDGGLGDQPFSEIYRNLFNCCPSLRYLVLSTNATNRRLFHYDQVEKKMKLVEQFDTKMNDFIITGTIAGSKMKFEFFPRSYFV